MSAEMSVEMSAEMSVFDNGTHSNGIVPGSAETNDIILTGEG